MKINKLVVTLCFVMFYQLVIGQDFTESWEGYFSYLNIKDIAQGSSKVFGAAENAIFIYDTTSNDMDTLSTINGLSGETISNLHYIEDNGLLFIGFENGLIQIYSESNQEFKTVVDIIDKVTIPSDKKQINDFNVFNGYVYISTNYGISLFDINNLEFGDTYFIGPNGTQIEVNQAIVFQDKLYAATEIGILNADINNPNLIDYQQWTTSVSGNWVGIQSVDQKLYVARNNADLFEMVSSSLNLLENYSSTIEDLRNFGNKLIVTTQNEVHIYTSAPFTEIALVQPNTEFQTIFSSAIITEENDIFVGTKKQENLGKAGFGILKTTATDTEILEEIHPECPLSNNFFQIRQQSNQIWATHGGHSQTYGWNGGVRRSGVSNLIENEWRNITFDSLTTVTPSPWFISYLSINPLNSNDVYISSYFSGLIERTSETLSIYNQNNSTILPFVANFYLTAASNYDPSGNLWVMAGRTNFSLNKFSNGNWNSYSLQALINPPTSNLGFSAIAFDRNNNLFIGSHNYGLIGFNENNGSPIIKNVASEDQNVPSTGVTSVALDKQNQIWFGTYRGLRVIYSIDDFFDNVDYQPSEIIILDDDTPRELLFQQYVTDIEVDGANNKWISTLDTGVYYFSSDGQETIYHFTKDNSPLPSNDVIDVALDEVNGLVYFATNKGMVSFNSETSAPENDFQEAYIYPNPVRPNFNMNDEKIKIKGITGNVNIKITDIEGNLVSEAESKTNTKFSGYNLEISGGTALWNGRNMSNTTVASGVYLVMISDLDSFETTVLKLMVVR